MCVVLGVGNSDVGEDPTEGFQVVLIQPRNVIIKPSFQHINGHEQNGTGVIAVCSTVLNSSSEVKVIENTHRVFSPSREVAH